MVDEQDFASLLGTPPHLALDLSQAQIDAILASFAPTSGSSSSRPLASLVLARQISETTEVLLQHALVQSLKKGGDARIAALELLATSLSFHEDLLAEDAPLRKDIAKLMTTDLESKEAESMSGLLTTLAMLPPLRQFLVVAALPFLYKTLGPRPEQSHVVELEGDRIPTDLTKARAVTVLVVLELATEEQGLQQPDKGKAKAEDVRWTLEELQQVIIPLLKPKVSEKSLLVVLEALAYLTLSSSSIATSRKNAVAPSLLCSLPSTPAIAYPLSALLVNLLSYPPPDQAFRLPSTSATESRTVVSARIAKFITHKDFVSTLAQLSKSESSQARANAARIIVATAEDKPNRPALLSGGIGKSLLLIIASIPRPNEKKTQAKSGQSPLSALMPAVQALAKLLITAQPSLVFTPTLLQDAARALVLPLTSEDDSGSILLVQFECLLALTNIASCAFSLADLLTRLVVPPLSSLSAPLTSPTTSSKGSPLLELVDNFALSPHTLLRRASVELLCNLVATPAGVDFFGPPSPSARLAKLLALVHSEDEATGLAALGALAGLADCSPVLAQAIWRSQKDFEASIIECLEVDKDVGVRLRAWHVVRSIVDSFSAETGEEDEQKRKRETLEILQKHGREDTAAEVIEVAEETLAAMKKALP